MPRSSALSSTYPVQGGHPLNRKRTVVMINHTWCPHRLSYALRYELHLPRPKGPLRQEPRHRDRPPDQHRVGSFNRFYEFFTKRAVGMDLKRWLSTSCDALRKQSLGTETTRSEETWSVAEEADENDGWCHATRPQDERVAVQDCLDLGCSCESHGEEMTMGNEDLGRNLRILECTPYEHNRGRGRPKTRWRDEFTEDLGTTFLKFVLTGPAKCVESACERGGDPSELVEEPVQSALGQRICNGNTRHHTSWSRGEAGRRHSRMRWTHSTSPTRTSARGMCCLSPVVRRFFLAVKEMFTVKRTNRVQLTVDLCNEPPFTTKVCCEVSVIVRPHNAVKIEPEQVTEAPVVPVVADVPPMQTQATPTPEPVEEAPEEQRMEEENFQEEGQNETPEEIFRSTGYFEPIPAVGPQEHSPISIRALPNPIVHNLVVPSVVNVPMRKQATPTSEPVEEAPVENIQEEGQNETPEIFRSSGYGEAAEAAVFSHSPGHSPESAAPIVHNHVSRISRNQSSLIPEVPSGKCEPRSFVRKVPRAAETLKLYDNLLARLEARLFKGPFGAPFEESNFRLACDSPSMSSSRLPVSSTPRVTPAPGFSRTMILQCSPIEPPQEHQKQRLLE